MEYYGTGELQMKLETTLEDVEKTMKLFADIEGIVGPLTGRFVYYRQTLQDLHETCTRRLKEIHSNRKPK